MPATVTPDFIHSVIDKVRNASGELSSLQLDWSACIFIDKIGLCLVVNLFTECATRKLKVFNAPITVGDFFAREIAPIVNFPISALDTTEFNTPAFVTAVNDIEKALARVELMRKYFQTHDQLRKLDTGPIEIIFSELYMNVCQHSFVSQLENGVVLISIDSNTHLLEFVVSDIGVGIPANIKDTFPDFANSSDEEAIVYATEDLVTTKTTEQNYGRGLSTLKTSVTTMNGTLEIFSGYGHYHVSPQKENKQMLSQYCNGTQIRVLVDLRNFEIRDDSSFSEEVTF